MKNLQTRYNLLHFFYFVAYCGLLGFTAVMLQYKGLSNSLIGIVTGGGALLSIIVSPLISSLPDKYPNLSMQKVIVYIVAITSVFFAVLTWVNIPVALIIVLYMANICAYGSIIPFLSAICMNYIQAGYELNFGLARGLGSIAYAVSAVVIGRLIDLIDPTVPAVVYIVFNILFLIILKSLPEVAQTAPSAGESHGSSTMIGVIRKYKTYFMFLLGLSLPFSAAVALAPI